MRKGVSVGINLVVRNPREASLGVELDDDDDDDDAEHRTV